MLHLDLSLELIQTVLLVLKNLMCLLVISFRLLELLENLFHRQEFLSFGHIDVKNECVDHDHLLVKPQSLSSHGHCSVLKASNDALKQFHVHVSRH